jgi:hypothetical protein
VVITSTEKTEMTNVEMWLFNIQKHIPVKLREDLMLNTVEIIWLQVHYASPAHSGGKVLQTTKC